MRRAKNHGFILSWVINCLFRMEWVLIAMILLVLHIMFDWPLWLMFIPLGIWLLIGLIITLVFSLANAACASPQPKKKNKNPYSAGE